MKNLVSFLAILLFALSINAQTSELTLEKGVPAHKGMDGVYAKFSEAYRTLNVEIVANLYSADAKYLPPENKILNGRDEIRPNFQSFFDYVKSRGENMTISFHIFQRKVSKDMGYDVGIYTIQTFKDGKKIGEGKGKFVVVAVKNGQNWQFQVDGYSGLKPDKKD